MIEPILARHEPSLRDGPPRVDDRVRLTGIRFVRKTASLGRTSRRRRAAAVRPLWIRLGGWRRDGVWEALHRLLLDL